MILTLNAGSSSLKFALFDAAMDETARGEIENLAAAPHLKARYSNGVVLAEQTWPEGGADPFETALDALLAFADGHLGGVGLAAVGHRVVHGGAHHIEPALVTPALLAELDALTRLDPLHMPAGLRPMRAVAASRPRLTQVACFDTAFHHTMPRVATRIALPHTLDPVIRRYGFHGLSYEYIAGQLAQVAPDLAKGCVIVAHLGSGASLCALQDGRSIATSMGFSALDGLMMATRCGSLDPGVVLYLGQQGHSFAEIEDMLYRRSGLLGVSGISGDIRVLLASDATSAHEAIELFTYRIAGQAASLVAALGGLDGLVFTGGIGEHAPAIRADVCTRLAWLGLRFDAAGNAANASCIGAPDSSVDIRVIATDEEAVIARHTARLLRE